MLLVHKELGGKYDCEKAMQNNTYYPLVDTKPKYSNPLHIEVESEEAHYCFAHKSGKLIGGVSLKD